MLNLTPARDLFAFPPLTLTSLFLPDFNLYAKTGNESLAEDLISEQHFRSA